jgi:hypothetical protein
MLATAATTKSGIKSTIYARPLFRLSRVRFPKARWA